MYNQVKTYIYFVHLDAQKARARFWARPVIHHDHW